MANRITSDKKQRDFWWGFSLSDQLGGIHLVQLLYYLYPTLAHFATGKTLLAGLLSATSFCFPYSTPNTVQGSRAIPQQPAQLFPISDIKLQNFFLLRARHLDPESHCRACFPIAAGTKRTGLLLDTCQTSFWCGKDLRARGAPAISASYRDGALISTR